METRLYGQLRKTRAVALDDEIATISQAYLDMAVAGTCSTTQRDLFVDAGHRMIRDHGAEAIVLAGTDLTLVFGGQNPGYRVIDPLEVHVDILTRLATDRISLKDLEPSL